MEFFVTNPKIHKRMVSQSEFSTCISFQLDTLEEIWAVKIKFHPSSSFEFIFISSPETWRFKVVNSHQSTKILTFAHQISSIWFSSIYSCKDWSNFLPPIH